MSTGVACVTGEVPAMPLPRFDRLAPAPAPRSSFAGALWRQLTAGAERLVAHLRAHPEDRAVPPPHRSTRPGTRGSTRSWPTACGSA